ncbi:MAG: flagellar basal-body rod protein FlgG [bacterium]|nr:flagellar basal-body rod protein FlgG [bacterium]
MMRALWSAASGMTAQMLNVDVIANNLANVSTTGYKKDRVDFQDLLYQILRLPGTPLAEGTPVPTGIQVGLGTNPVSTQKMHDQGSPYETGNPLDIAIIGEGFFRVLLPDGTIAYTRDGAFKRSSDGRMVTSDGYILEPEIVLPDDASGGDITISEDGAVSVILPGETTHTEIGHIELARFINPAGMKSIGKNLFRETDSSGAPFIGEPCLDGLGYLKQRFLERSNVNIVDEMVGMIVAQRAYELNARAIRTGDMMLGEATGLRR